MDACPGSKLNKVFSMARSPVTPRRIYHQSNICVICGFSFVQSEVSKTGAVIEKKYLNKKLKISEERIKHIRKVLQHFEIEKTSVNGICVSCYRKIEKVNQMQNDFKNLQKELTESRSSVRELYQLTCKKSQDNKSDTQKRLPKSPLQDVQQPLKHQKTLTYTVVHLCQIPTFEKIISSTDNVSDVPPTSSMHKEKKQSSAKRSLGFSTTVTDKENERDYLIGEVKDFSFQIPSIHIIAEGGERSSFVLEENHKQICRAVFRGQNVEKCIIEIISKSNPDVVTTAACKLVSTECKSLCKRGSDSILQQKTYEGIFGFTWDSLYKEIQVRAPNTLRIVSAIVSDIPIHPTEKNFLHLMNSLGTCFHGRDDQISSMQYQVGFLLAHGGCKVRDIERLAKLGLCMSPKSLFNKLSSWEKNMDVAVVKAKQQWIESGGTTSTYQIIGDNWDKNIIPVYRNSQDKTISLHLFNVLVVMDRISCEENMPETMYLEDFPLHRFIPSVNEQEMLSEELTFIIATSVIQNIDQMQNVFGKIYPVHLNHKYSEYAGLKTTQYSLGLFDCDENKTQDVIRLLKGLNQYVPVDENGNIEEVFFGGDRLTDERIQSAQRAMNNAPTPLDKLQGFISKIEDWHRMMNFLEH